MNETSRLTAILNGMGIDDASFPFRLGVLLVGPGFLATLLIYSNAVCLCKNRTNICWQSRYF